MQLTISAISALAGFFTFRAMLPVSRSCIGKVQGAKVAKSFDWPRRDDVDVHLSSVSNGPVQLIGNSPFTILQEEQIKKVFLYIQKN